MLQAVRLAKLWLPHFAQPQSPGRLPPIPAAAAAAAPAAARSNVTVVELDDFALPHLLHWSRDAKLTLLHPEGLSQSQSPGRSCLTPCAETARPFGVEQRLHACFEA
eukprot:COSAG06_NODE_8260_length_2222_cov_1.527555_3_plen_107_part_00